MTSDLDAELVWLCSSAVAGAGATSCGVTMVTASGQNVTAHASDSQARAVEDLQHTLGEGPGVTASSSGTAVLVPDLTDRLDRGLQRWPLFVPATVEIGVLATFAFPLLIGTSSIGALSLYRSVAGGLGGEGLTRGWAVADAVAQNLVEPAEKLPGESALVDPMRVHQAAGMVMVQLDVPIGEALLRLRATAFAEGRSVDDLAVEIVARRRRLAKEDP